MAKPKFDFKEAMMRRNKKKKKHKEMDHKINKQMHD